MKELQLFYSLLYMGKSQYDLENTFWNSYINMHSQLQYATSMKNNKNLN